MDHVKVLQHHIDQGQRGCPTACAVALALREYFPEASMVEVDGSDLRVYLPETTLWASSPGAVFRFIRHFDEPDGTPSQPFEFRAAFVPEEFIKPRGDA